MDYCLLACFDDRALLLRHLLEWSGVEWTGWLSTVLGTGEAKPSQASGQQLAASSSPAQGASCVLLEKTQYLTIQKVDKNTFCF
jgi:hypothetical protein